MKKTYLLINEGISSLLEKAHPKEFKTIFLEVQSENIRIIDGRDSKILHEHAIPWILKLGIYEEDPRLFGFIVSEARQGEKTRMLCHVFRCGRVTTSVAATEAIRLGCQATYSERRDSARANKRISFLSSSSNGSQECSGSPPSSDSSDVVVRTDPSHQTPLPSPPPPPTSLFNIPCHFHFACGATHVVVEVTMYSIGVHWI